jgi:hypothetical protein
VLLRLCCSAGAAGLGRRLGSALFLIGECKFTRIVILVSCTLKIPECTQGTCVLSEGFAIRTQLLRFIPTLANPRTHRSLLSALGNRRVGVLSVCVCGGG